jgi:UDPglucose 6-dehydrogenase
VQDLKEVSGDDAARVDKLVTITSDPYAAMNGCHAIVVLTEWGEFLEYDYEKVYETM